MFKKAVIEIRKDMDAAAKFMVAGSMGAGLFDAVDVSDTTLVVVSSLGAVLWLIAKAMIVLEGDDPGG